MKWKTIPLGSALTFQRGFDITKGEQKSGPYPVISSSGPKSFHAEYKATGPGVVIGRKGSLGTVFYCPGNYWPHDTTLWIKDFHGNHPKFAYYFLQTMGFERYDVGASNPSLNRNHIHKILTSWPSRDKQEEVAEILSGYDNLITNSQRRMEILEKMLRSIYFEWFVDYRFPGAAKDFDQKSGNLPKDWKVTKLTNVADVNARQLSASSSPGIIRYIDISSVSPGKINSTTNCPFSEAPGRARRIVRHGDVLWSCVRPNRRSYALVLNPENNTIASTGFAVLSATKVPFSFLYLATTTNDFVGYLTNNATGAAYPAVTASIFEKAELVVPSNRLLEVFDCISAPLTQQIHLLQKQVQILERTRDALLKRLITMASQSAMLL